MSGFLRRREAWTCKHCKVAVDRWKLFCGACWSRLPVELRQEYRAATAIEVRARVVWKITRWLEEHAAEAAKAKDHPRPDEEGAL